MNLIFISTRIFRAGAKSNNVKPQRVAITFDVDMVDYAGPKDAFDEMDDCFPIIKNILKKFPEVRTTWFLRIDAQMREVFGYSDYLFIKHGEKIEWLRAAATK